MILFVGLNALILLLMPFALIGVLNRVKSLWSGRKGPPILQSAFDVARLLRKAPVYSRTTSWIFRAGPRLFFATSILSAAIVPLLGSTPIVSFPFDFVWFAYVWGLGRMCIMLAALDTGSAFEGMGASREATFATLLEPVLFLVVGALSLHTALQGALQTGQHSLSAALSLRPTDAESLVLWSASIFALLIVLQVEAARIPIDDPATHLELTMVHEAMILDHSGPELAAIQWASAIKFLIGSAILATLLNPWSGKAGWLPALTNLCLCFALAVLIGTVESLMSRLRLALVPRYIALGFTAGLIALAATLWRTGSPG
jgi:formate hydrogenlyase subunit 4